MAVVTLNGDVDMRTSIFIKGDVKDFKPTETIVLQADWDPNFSQELYGSFTWDLETDPNNPILNGYISSTKFFTVSHVEAASITFDSSSYLDASTYQTLVSSIKPISADVWVFSKADKFNGSDAAEYLIGYGGADTLYGGAGDDTLKGGADADSIDGGAGDDTGVFEGSYALSTIRKNSDGSYTVSNSIDGTDTIRNVEFFQFSDKTVGVSTLSSNTYNWSSLTNNQQLAFNPASDKLTFDDATISPASLLVGWGASNSGYVTLTYGGKAVTLLTDVKSLTTSNVTFSSGGLLIIGDNSTGVSSDDGQNVINGSAQADHIIGLGGNDVINAGDGNDVINIGYATGVVGNDTIDGGAGTDVLAFIQSNTATPAITVDMAKHSVQSAQGVLTIKNIERIFGTANADSFQGGALEHKIDSLGNIVTEIFRGNGGNDTIQGAVFSQNPQWNDGDYRVAADYSNNTSAQAISADLHTGLVSDGLGGTDRLTFVSVIIGGAGNDLIVGGSSTRCSYGIFWEMYRGNGGDDTLNGGNQSSDGADASSDRADYSINTSAQAINVNLVTGRVSDGLGGTDTLIDIDQVWGGAGNDTFLGGAGNEVFDGGAGNDSIDGGGGSNRVSYKQSTGGVIVNLGSSSITVDTSVYAVTGMSGSKTVAAGTANDGMGGTDALANITNVNGSDYADYLRGSDSAGVRSFLSGFGGNNILVGGNSVAIADYSNLPLYFGFSVFVASLVPNANGKVTINNYFGGTDTLINIYGLAGTHGEDSLTGSGADEYFRGNGGSDTIDGGAGDDWVIYTNSPSGVSVNLATGYATDGWNGQQGLLGLGGTDRLFNIENAEGSNYNDTLTGGVGDNIFKGLSGDDVLDGGAGNDTVIFQGAAADYVITRQSNGSYTIRDIESGRDGTDTVVNVEILKFTDKNVVLSANLAPDITSSGSVSIAENVSTTTPVYTAQANDPDANTTLVYSLGGVDAGLFNINASTGVVTFKASPNYEAPADQGANNVYDIVVRVSDGANTTEKAVAITVTDVVETRKAVSDLNGDGKSDILLNNTKFGQYYQWEMNGHVFLKDGSYGSVGWVTGPDWSAKTAGDFNGDGKSDVLLQNSKDGSCFVWEMNGLSLLSDKSFGIVGWTPGKDWLVKGAGDFNGDGKSDILLQNSTDGGCFVWEMNGLGLLNENSYGVVGWAPGKDWVVKATADFNGDGKSDILLQNSTDGTCFVWEMDGLGLLSDKSYGVVGWTPGKDWVAKGAGDFNGDGKSDILLQNSTDGACFVWEMNGLSLLSENSYGRVGWTPGKEWEAKGTGDYNGDGKSDILLQNSVTGDCYVWHVDGLSLLSKDGYGSVGWTPGPDWHAVV